MNTIVIGLTRLGIAPRSTISAADAPSTQPLTGIGFLTEKEMLHIIHTSILWIKIAKKGYS